jgi:hypothetical protein
MDCWTDSNQKLYMAVTAHWLESTSDQGRQQNLNLRADLVVFLLVPGQHTGDRLAD